MSEIISIDGLRCVNLVPNRRAIAAGRFEIQNPCSWCENRKHVGQPGPAFYYVEYGRWEFPFVAETNCASFSLIHRPGRSFDADALRKAKRIHQQRDRISDLGSRYRSQWSAFDPSELPEFMGRNLFPGQVVYPNELTINEFFREASMLRSDMFELRNEIHSRLTVIERTYGINDSRLESHISTTSEQMKLLTSQIDEIESSRPDSRLSVISKWAISTVSGGASWEALKRIKDLIREIMTG